MEAACSSPVTVTGEVLREMILEFPKHVWIQTGSEFDFVILGEIL